MQSAIKKEIKEQAQRVIQIGKEQGLTAKDIAKKSLLKINSRNIIEEKDKHKPGSKEFKALVLLELLKPEKRDNQVFFEDGTVLDLENLRK
ncbi:MAG: hypothetical protein ACOC22_02700 [bacterium]